MNRALLTYLILLFALTTYRAGGQVTHNEQATSPTVEKKTIVKLAPELLKKADEQLYRLGLNKIKQGKFAEAEAIFHHLLKRSPEFKPAYSQLARAQIGLKKIEQAYKHAKKGVKLRPDSSLAHRTLGRVYRLQDKRLLAIEEFKKACALDPKNAWNFNNLGLTLLELGRYQEALPPLERAVELNSSQYVMFNNLAIVRLKLGDKAGALRAFEKVVELAPKFTSAQRYVAQLREELRATPTATLKPSQRITTPTLEIDKSQTKKDSNQLD